MGEERLGNLETDLRRTLVASGSENLVVETQGVDTLRVEGLVPIQLFIK